MLATGRSGSMSWLRGPWIVGVAISSPALEMICGVTQSSSKRPMPYPSSLERESSSNLFYSPTLCTRHCRQVRISFSSKKIVQLYVRQLKVHTHYNFQHIFYHYLSDLVTVRDPEDDDDTPDPKTIVAVEVFDTKTGATHYWSLEKLR